MTVADAEGAEISSPGPSPEWGRRLLVGFDGSPSAAASIGVAALLVSRATAWIVYLWTPPFTSPELRHRLWAQTESVAELTEAIEREGGIEAIRLAETGVTLARATGWEAHPVVRRSFGGDGLQFAQLATTLDSDLVVVGSRGLSGTSALLGSASDVVVHHSPRPVLVVPHPLLSEERAAVAEGPILIGWDGIRRGESRDRCDSTALPQPGSGCSRGRSRAR